MKYKCTKLVGTHLPLELFNEIERIADGELLSRSQVIRDAIWSYIVSRQEPDAVDIRSTRKLVLQNGLWDTMFNGKR